MATYAPSTSTLPYRNAAFKPAASAPSQPAGTFLPETKVTVGSHRVIIQKYLSEGGFAHVYVVRIPRDNHKHELAVLKRVAVPDKEHLANMRTEVETMKKLKGHKHIVTYIDSHASQLKGTGYEVFLLMEYCNGGGLIDFMNTRLQHRLTEPEILKIFGDVAEGVACMHYLKPPLLHRDLKVENILIAKSVSGTPSYKVCDFGSTAPPRPAAKTAEEGRLIEEDVQKHTTMQYRSPEMIDVWRKQPIDEKADIWALGVLLYKLCYYTTPFEEVGQMAILNASFKYPSYPAFSDRLKKFIGSMLKENPKDRPNIYQVIKETCSMRGTEVPIKDIYAARTQSQQRRNEQLPSPDLDGSFNIPAIGLSRAPPEREIQSIPDIAPMRRGRPTAPAQQVPGVASARSSAQPSPSKGDPFAALDSKNFDVRAKAVDELAQKYPSLDEFSIVHERGGKFKFDQNSPTANDSRKGNLNERVTNALADEVFKVDASTPQTKIVPAAGGGKSGVQTQQRKTSPPKPVVATTARKEPVHSSPMVQQPTPVRPGGVRYTSTGTNPSPPPPSKSSPLPPSKMPEISKRPVWRVPTHHKRSESQPRASDAAKAEAENAQGSRRPRLLNIHRSKSQTAGQMAMTKSSRPSLEGGRPSSQDIGHMEQARPNSTHTKQRPSSVYLNSNFDFLRDAEAASKRQSVDSVRKSTDGKRPSLDFRKPSRQTSFDNETAVDIGDDLTYLRSNEDDGGMFRKPSGHKHKKGSTSGLPGDAKRFVGKLGDAFKRFEHGGHAREAEGDWKADAQLMGGLVTPEHKEKDPMEDSAVLSPIAGSEATYSHTSDMESSFRAEEEDMPPEMRRELERRQLEQEERRVADAAKQYKNQVTGEGGPPGAKAKKIQDRVQTLLDEGRQSPAPRTASGYGRHTEDAQVESEALPKQAIRPPRTTSLAQAPASLDTGMPYQRAQQQVSQVAQPAPLTLPVSASAPPAQTATRDSGRRVLSRPSAPPKPQSLRKPGQWPPTQATEPSDASASSLRSTGLQALLAKDLEGVPDYPGQSSAGGNAARVQSPPDFTGGTQAMGGGGMNMGDNINAADLEADFSKRYPALTGIEMVETEISGEERRRVKEV